MARRKRCDVAGCESLLIDGTCPTPEIHGLQTDVVTLTDKREEDLLQKEAAIDRKMLELQAEQSTAQRLSRAAKLELATVIEEKDRALARLDMFASESRETPEWVTSTRKTTKHYGTLVALFSDLHAGEVVRPSEIDDFNKYDLMIAEMRCMRFFNRTIMLADKYLAGVTYDGIVVALMGDLVSGDIHEELVETNECSTYEAIFEVYPWIVKGLEMLADRFGKVHVVSAPGNHGRNSRKVRHKKRSDNNADTMIARLVSRDMRADKRVTFDIPDAADVQFKIYDSVFLAEHGDDMRFNGTSEIGSIGPVKRGSGRTSNQMQRLKRPFDYMVLGHFHQLVPAYTQGFIMNGSIKGFDEYAKRGKFSPEDAQQFLGVVTPERGITASMPIIVHDRSAEGW